MTTSVGTSADGHPSDTGGPLEVRLEIEPHEEAGCAVADLDGSVSEVSQRLKRDGEHCCDDRFQCQAAVTLEASGREYLSVPTGPQCVCPVFERTDCISALEAVRNGTLVVSLTVPDRTALRQTIDELKEIGASVNLLRLTQVAEEGEATVELDTTNVTPKQREAVEVAVTEGYYDDPRRTDLADLAARLDISKSAVSQRLNAVEAKLVRALVEETG